MSSQAFARRTAAQSPPLRRSRSRGLADDARHDGPRPSHAGRRRLIARGDSPGSRPRGEGRAEGRFRAPRTSISRGDSTRDACTEARRLHGPGPDNVWSVLALPWKVADAARVADDFLLSPLVPLIGRGNGAIVAVVGREQGRVLALRGGRFEQVADRTEETQGRHDQGGWSQSLPAPPGQPRPGALQGGRGGARAPVSRSRPARESSSSRATRPGPSSPASSPASSRGP